MSAAAVVVAENMPVDTQLEEPQLELLGTQTAPLAEQLDSQASRAVAVAEETKLLPKEERQAQEKKKQPARESPPTLCKDWKRHQESRQASGKDCSAGDSLNP